MSVPGFLFGGNTGVTPDKLKRDRAVAEAILANAQRGGAPRNTGEGLHAIGQALGYRFAKARADKGGEVEAEKQAAHWKTLSAGGASLFGPGMLSAPGSSHAPLGSPSAGQSRSAASGTSDAFLSSLIGTESGGRWDAQNDVSGAGGHRGHFGRLQFGQARLAEAAAAGVIPAGTSPQTFMRSPEAQQAVEAWHFADIDRQAERRGLLQYVGQNVGGARITPDAIRAMAHLGGIGGAERFLRSGGRHNPADAYGTSLLDYARKHGGASAAAEQIGVAHDPSRPYAPSQVDPEQIARTMQGTQVVSLDPSIGLAPPVPSKGRAVAQALGLRGETAPQGPSPAAAALNGIVQQPSAPVAPQPQPARYAQASVPAMGGPNPQMLMGIMADPWASEEQRSVAQFLMQQQMTQQQTAQERAYEAQQLQERRAYDDRVRQEEYAREDRQGFRPATAEEASQYGAQAGQIGPDGRFYDTTSSGSGNQESFFGNPIAIQNPDGTVGYGQIGNRGSFRPIDLGEGQTFAPPTKTVDTGTETILMDQAGNVIARTPKENYQEAYDTSRGKVEGEAMGDRVTGIGQTEATAQQTLDTLDRLENHPGFSSAVGWQGALPRWMSAPAGSEAAGFMSILDQVQGQAFLQAFESLKGGGQITEIEGQKATAAITRLSRAISEEEFRAAVQELRDIVNTGVERARRGVAAAPPTTAAPGGGTVGTPQNPIQLDTVTVPAGMDQALWEIMTPEEKSLWLN